MVRMHKQGLYTSMNSVENTGRLLTNLELDMLHEDRKHVGSFMWRKKHQAL